MMSSPASTTDGSAGQWSAARAAWFTTQNNAQLLASSGPDEKWASQSRNAAIDAGGSPGTTVSRANHAA
jgi:hypothetical protein